MLSICPISIGLYPDWFLAFLLIPSFEFVCSEKHNSRSFPLSVYSKLIRTRCNRFQNRKFKSLSHKMNDCTHLFHLQKCKRKNISPLISNMSWSLTFHSFASRAAWSWPRSLPSQHNLTHTLRTHLTNERMFCFGNVNNIVVTINGYNHALNSKQTLWNIAWIINMDVEHAAVHVTIKIPRQSSNTEHAGQTRKIYSFLLNKW